MNAVRAQLDSGRKGRIKRGRKERREEIQAGVIVLNRSIDMTTCEVHYGCMGIDADLKAFRICVCFPYYQHFSRELPEIRVGGMYFIKGLFIRGLDGQVTLFNPHYRPVKDLKVRQRMMDWLAMDIHEQDLFYRFIHVDEDLKDYYDRSLLM